MNPGDWQGGSPEEDKESIAYSTQHTAIFLKEIYSKALFYQDPLQVRMVETKSSPGNDSAKKEYSTFQIEREPSCTCTCVRLPFRGIHVCRIVIHIFWEVCTQYALDDGHVETTCYGTYLAEKGFISENQLTTRPLSEKSRPSGMSK